MDKILSRYHSDRYVDKRMGETQEKSKEYDLNLSYRFNIVDFLR
jgi:hypothetical protein